MPHPTRIDDDDGLLSVICSDPDLLAAFRADPVGVAHALGVSLADGAAEAFAALEADAVTDVLLESTPPVSADPARG